MLDALGGRVLRLRALDAQSHQIPSTSRLEHDRGLPTSPSPSQAIRSHSDPPAALEALDRESRQVPPSSPPRARDPPPFSLVRPDAALYGSRPNVAPPPIQNLPRLPARDDVSPYFLDQSRRQSSSFRFDAPRQLNPRRDLPLPRLDECRGPSTPPPLREPPRSIRTSVPLDLDGRHISHDVPTAQRHVAPDLDRIKFSHAHLSCGGHATQPPTRRQPREQVRLN